MLRQAPWLVLLSWLFSILCVLPLQAATFTATIDRPAAGLNEAVVLSLTFEGGEPSAVPNVAAVPGLSIQYSGRSSQISIVGGRTTATTSHNFVVTGSKEGDYTIPSIAANVGGQVLRSQPVRLKISRNPDAGEESANVGFLRLVFPRTNVFVGEAFPIEVQLYAQSGQLRQMPQVNGDGFTVGKLVQQSREQQVQVGNALYYLVSFKAPVVVVKTGDLKFTAGDCILEVQVRRRGGRQRSPIDPFGGDPFDDFFGRVETRRFTLTSEPVVIKSDPLPAAGRPPGFSGAVGRFDFAVEAGATNIAVGDPITLRMQIQGSGALDSLQGFNIEWPGFKSYPPTAKTESPDPLGLTGTRTFEQVVVPEKADIKEIPMLVFSFFDPELRTYRTLRNPPIPLIVRPSGAGVAAPTVLAGSPQPATPPRQDILHIKPRPGTFASSPVPLVERPLFVALQVIPIVLWIGLVLWRRSSEALASNPRLRRKRHVDRLIAEGLAELPGLVQRADAEQFFATVVRLLQERLGERLDLPASAITEAVIEDRLRPAGAPEATLESLRELFQTCNLARYAPTQTEQQLAALAPKVKSVLEELRNLP